jgi:hypothetical protein
VSWSKGDRFTPAFSLSYTWNVARVTSEISSSAKGVTAVLGGSEAATEPFAGSAKDSPAAPSPATLKTEKAFFDRFPFEAGFISGIIRLHDYLRAPRVRFTQLISHSWKVSICIASTFLHFIGNLLQAAPAAGDDFSEIAQV